MNAICTLANEQPNHVTAQYLLLNLKLITKTFITKLNIKSCYCSKPKHVTAQNFKSKSTSNIPYLSVNQDGLIT